MPQAESTTTTTAALPATLGTEPLTMSSREIADLVEARHNDVVETIGRLFAKEVLRESRKTLRPYSPPGGGRPTNVYDLTKRDTLVVASGYDDALRAKIIDRWMELEAAEAPMAAFDPANPTVMLAVLDHLRGQVQNLEGQVAEMTPQVQALERIAVSDGSLCITDAAKTLQVRPKDLFAFLRSNGWIYARPGAASEVAYQARLVDGSLEHKTTTVLRSDGSEKTVTQVRVTLKGLTKLAKLLPATAKLI